MTTKNGKKVPKWYNIGEQKDRGKIRSKFFPGVAQAMAEQWGLFYPMGESAKNPWGVLIKKPLGVLHKILQTARLWRAFWRVGRVKNWDRFSLGKPTERHLEATQILA